MVKTLRCSDIGVACDAVICGDSEQELLHNAKEHALVEHGMQTLSADQERQIKAAIRDEDSCPVEGHAGRHGMSV